MTTIDQSLVNPVKHPQSMPLRIIAIGDSLIYGYGDREGGGWVERLRRQWMDSEQDHALYNLGVRGDRTAQVQNRLEKEWSHRGELRNKYPDLIILSVGVNDSPRLGHPQGKNLTNFTHFAEDIANLLDQAQALCPLLFVGMIPVDEVKMPFLDCFYYNLRDQYRYKEVTKQACQSRNIPYFDTFDLWMSRGENWRRSQMSADGLHPNVSGYKSLFNEVNNWQPIKNIA